MSISINYKNSSNKKNSSNIVLFIDEKFNVSKIKQHISTSEFLFISDILKTTDTKKKNSYNWY